MYYLLFSNIDCLGLLLSNINHLNTRKNINTLIFKLLNPDINILIFNLTYNLHLRFNWEGVIMKQLLNPSVIAWSIIFMSNPFSIRINELKYQSFIAPVENYTITEDRIDKAFYGLTDHQSVYSLVY